MGEEQDDFPIPDDVTKNGRRRFRRILGVEPTDEDLRQVEAEMEASPPLSPEEEAELDRALASPYARKLQAAAVHSLIPEGWGRDIITHLFQGTMTPEWAAKHEAALDAILTEAGISVEVEDGEK